LDTRIAEHQAGAYDGSAARRRPVALVFHQSFERLDDAAAAERQVKGWRRDKKKALIRGDFFCPSVLGSPWRNRSASFETPPGGPLLRMTKSSNLKGLRHAEERPRGASRSARGTKRRIE